MGFSEILNLLQQLQEKSDERFDLTVNNKSKTIKIKYVKENNGTSKQTDKQ